ncbi:MAG TPA: S53 family peptidase, partial [Candidatus Acidoferrum sp.]
MSVLANRILALFVLFVPLFLAASPASAQSTPEAQFGVAEQNFVRMERSSPALAAKAADLGRVEAGKNIDRMLLMLSPSAEQEAALQLFMEQQQNPASVNFHHWLKPSEFGARFGADAADVQRVRSWLEGSGFRISAAAKSGRWIEFAGTSSQVENAFRTELHYFQLAGKHYLANTKDISLPSSIAQISRGLVSLNNFPKRPPTQLRAGIAGITAQGQKVRLTPNLTAVGNANTFYLAPGDFAAIYNTKPLLSGGNDGGGISIAITAQSQIELTDVEAFRQIFRLKTNDPNIYVSGPDPGIGASIDQQEATLDVEWAGAVAPGATINLVIAGSTDSTNGVDLAAAYAIDNQIAPILTYTYGSCEQSLQASGNAFYNALWQQAAAEGITVLVATGDNGSAGCDADAPGSAATGGMTVNGAATTPFNVAVGGTQFNDTATPATFWSGSNNADYSSALGYIPESAWNESCDTAQPTGPTNCFFSNGNFSTLASGGGASMIYAKPSWQSGAGVPMDGFRDIPDVALAAASGHDDIVYCNSQGGTACEINAQNQVVGLTLVGGTSASTPAMAGILALIEAKNGAYQGQINYTLYKLAKN